MKFARMTATVGAAALSGTGLILVTATPALASGPAVATTTVNIRSGPGTSSAVVGRLVRGQRISTAGGSSSGWVGVRFAGKRAYIAKRYLNTSGRSLPAAPRTISTSGTKVATETLNVRTGPGVRRAVVGTIREGARLTLTGRLSSGFAQTRYASHLRWVSITYLASTPGTARAVTHASSSSSSTRGAVALAFAKRQLGKPYRFGATGPNSYDCSGLTLQAWHAAGVSIPRTSQQQYAHGHRIAKSSLRPGDLVFFYSQRPSHVAIYAGHGQVIHAPRPGKTVQYIKMSYMPYAGAVRPG